MIKRSSTGVTIEVYQWKIHCLLKYVCSVKFKLLSLMNNLYFVIWLSQHFCCCCVTGGPYTIYCGNSNLWSNSMPASDWCVCLHGLLLHAPAIKVRVQLKSCFTYTQFEYTTETPVECHRCLFLEHIYNYNLNNNSHVLTYIPFTFMIIQKCNQYISAHDTFSLLMHSCSAMHLY